MTKVKDLLDAKMAVREIGSSAFLWGFAKIGGFAIFCSHRLLFPEKQAWWWKLKKNLDGFKSALRPYWRLGKVTYVLLYVDMQCHEISLSRQFQSYSATLAAWNLCEVVSLPFTLPGGTPSGCGVSLKLSLRWQEVYWQCKKLRAYQINGPL